MWQLKMYLLNVKRNILTEVFYIHFKLFLECKRTICLGKIELPFPTWFNEDE